jgi:hypothetical protein
MAIYTVPFSVYERLASAKMEALRSAINSHTHDGIYGVKIPFTDLDGTLNVATQIAAGSITGGVGGHLAPNTITNYNISPSTITFSLLDTTTIHLSAGYAVYAP